MTIVHERVASQNEFSREQDEIHLAKALAYFSTGIRKKEEQTFSDTLVTEVPGLYLFNAMATVENPLALFNVTPEKR